MNVSQLNLRSEKFDNNIIIIIKYASNILGNYEVKELQKTAKLGTAHIVRKVLT